MQIKVLKFGLALLSLLFVHQLTYADGVFIPPAKQKIPDIPVQRALVKYQAGTESLIIESTLNGENGDYGWIIPVPSQPTKFVKVSPGLLKTMAFQIQPKIHHVEPYGKVFGIRIEGLFAILVVITCFCIMRWGARGSILALAVLVISIFVVPNFIYYRSGSGETSKANPAVKITSSAIVGDYDVLILEVQDSSVLNTWLVNKGLSPFPVEAAPIVDDYIARDWVFAVAMLRTNSDGTVTPHPILLEFETDQPVYPMRLTGIPGSTLHLELYIVGESEAVPVNYNLKKEYCNHYDYGKIPDYRYNPLDNQTGFIPRKWLGPNMEIAHADASKVMWDGCVVTKLTGQVTSDEMMDDMFFQFQEANPYRSEVYSSTWAYNRAMDGAWVLLLIGSILLTLYHLEQKSRGIKVSILKLFIILIIASASGFGLSYRMVGEKTEVYTVEGYWYRRFQAHLADVFSIPSNDFANGLEFMEVLKREGIDNPITHKPLIMEHSPGNIVIEETGGIRKFSICLENGSLYTLF